jgi:hypothetical protein
MEAFLSAWIMLNVLLPNFCHPRSLLIVRGALSLQLRDLRHSPHFNRPRVRFLTLLSLLYEPLIPPEDKFVKLPPRTLLGFVVLSLRAYGSWFCLSIPTVTQFENCQCDFINQNGSRSINMYGIVLKELPGMSSLFVRMDTEE